MAVTRLDTVVLASAVTVNGTTTPVVIPVNGLITVYFTGTMGGATAQLQVSPDGGTTWFATSASSTTSGATATIQILATAIRVNITGGTGASISVQAVLPDYN